MNIQVRNLIIVGDKVLIKSVALQNKTKSGLLLPPGVKQKEKIQKGEVVAVGPGYALPSNEISENWNPNATKAVYLPLQAQEGDIAIFLQDVSHEIEYQKEKYFIVPHQAILMLERGNEFFGD